MEKCKVIGYVVAAGLCLAGCKPGPMEGVRNDIQFDSTLVSQQYHLLGNEQYPNCNLQIKFVYPDGAKADLLPKLQKQFVTGYFGEAYDTLAPKEAVERYTADYLGAYKDLEKDFEADMARADEDTPVGAWYSYYEMSSNQVRYNSNGLLSFTVQFENYTGGAHGAHAYNHFVLDANTGERIQEEDIYGEDYQELLAEILVHAITRDNDLSDPKELENIGFFSVDEIYPNNNFYVDDQGITYTFNEYEVAAYVVGPVHVHLSFDEVSVLLKPDTPVARLAGKS